MKSHSFALACVLSGVLTLAVAGDKGSKDEAVAMTKKAVAAITADHDKAIADINAGKWRDRDLYPMVYTDKGVNQAHGANPKLIGRDLSDLKDADGKLLLKCILGAGDTNGGKGAWCDYKWPNPVTKVVEAKSTYVEKTASNLYVAVGYYK